jgi:hypothetical protein
MWHAAGAAEQLALRCKVAVVDGRKRSRGLAGTEVAAVAWVPPNFKLRHVCNASELFCMRLLLPLRDNFTTSLHSSKLTNLQNTAFMNVSSNFSVV